MKKILTLFTALMVLGSMMVVQADYYVAHNKVMNSNEWNASGDKMAQVGSSNIYSITFNGVGTTKVEFKVTNGSWSQNWGDFDNAQSNVTLSNSGGNASFTLTELSDVTIYFDASAKKSYVQVVASSVPSFTFPAGTTIYYDFRTYGNGVNLYNSDWDNEWKDANAVANIIYITLSADWVVTASSYLFKSAASSWNLVTCSTLPTTGQNMLVSTDGLNFTWDTYSGGAPDPTPDPVKMHGTFADGSSWADTEGFNIAANEETASVTLNLAAGDYEFKVVVGSSWKGNGYTYHREFTGAEDIGNGGNMKLEADVAGDYTFTWTYATNALSITFPAEPTPEMVEVKFFAPRTEDNPWEHVYAYSYKGSRTFSDAWPGTEITNTKNAGWYMVSVRKGSDLIFTDNAGMQTDDIENIQAAACYESTAIDYSSSPKKVTVTVNASCQIAYYIAGSKDLIGGESDFDTNAALDENNQIVFQNVEPGTYSFKINNNTWAWALGGNDHLKSGECQSIAQTVGVGDVGFKIDTKQDVTITYYPLTQEICLGAVTVKADGIVVAEDMAIKAGESKKIEYWTNNTENPEVTYDVQSGSDNIALFQGVITGVKAGTATIRVTLAETANYTAASDEFTITISNPSAPAKAIEAIGGKFIINEKGDTAVFSRGNLKYNVLTDQWYCAEKQYERLGENANLHFGDVNYAGEYDLFGWSCTSSNYGLLQSNRDEDYTGEFVDWGGLFAGDENEWSSLSKDEWNYLFTHQNWTMMVLDPTPQDAENNDEICGLALFPYNWVQPSGFESLHNKFYDLDNEAQLADNTIDLAAWPAFEEAGAVFMPMTGARAGHWGNNWNGSAVDSRKNPNPNGGNSYCWVDNVLYYGYYWFSTPHATRNNNAYYLIMPAAYNTGVKDEYDEDIWAWSAPAVWDREKRRGNAVRLVTRIPNQWETIRTGLAAGNYYTVCHNKQMTAIKGATLWQFTGKDANFAYIEQVNAPFDAGKPYIVYATAETFEAKVEGVAVTDPGTNNGLHGTFVNLTQESFDAPGAQIYLVIGNQLRLVTGQNGNTLPAYRAYVELSEIPDGAPAPMPGRQIRSMALPKNTPTGMDQITNDQMPMTNKVIIDGRLFILRGEKMYDTTGRLVK